VRIRVLNDENKYNEASGLTIEKTTRQSDNDGVNETNKSYSVTYGAEGEIKTNF
jgi:hypothetical protein